MGGDTEQVLFEGTKRMKKLQQKVTRLSPGDEDEKRLGGVSIEAL
jgi:hypothetical protein